MITGYTILAVGSLFFFIPSLPETLRAVHLSTGINLDDPILNDKALVLYNTFFYLGSIIGPPLGGLLNDPFGYPITNDAMALLSIVFALCYMVFNIVMCDDHEYFVSEDP